MKRWRTAAASLGAALTVLAFASVPAGASDDAVKTKCQITAQPWRGHYNLSVELQDGTTVKLIDAEQHDRHETPPESFTFEVGEVAYVLWAQTRYPATGRSSWGSVLKVHGSECRWADGVKYDAQPNKRDSVVIAPIEVPVPTTTTEPPPVETTVPPVTTEPPVPPSTVPEPTTSAPPVETPPDAGSTGSSIPEPPIERVGPPTPFPEIPPASVPPEAGREPLPDPTTTTTVSEVVLAPPVLPMTGPALLPWLLAASIVSMGLGTVALIFRGRRDAEARAQG